MNRPTMQLFPTAPTLNIFSTTQSLNEIMPSVTVEVAGTSTSKPGWLCGVKVESRCRCEPGLYPQASCGTNPSLIAPNWGDDLIEDPTRPGSYCRAEKQIGCCVYEFNPVKVYETYTDPTGCTVNADLETRAAETVGSFSHRVVADLLVGSTNGNPGLAVHATDIAGGATVSPSVAFGALHQNHPADGAILVPWQSLALLIDAGLIHPIVSDGALAGYVDSWGYPIIVDPGFGGLTGPPATPWDGVTPIDPAVDLQQEPAGSGSAWMYITPPVWTGQSTPTTSTTRGPSSTSKSTLGNYSIGAADAEVLAVFNPCGIRAIKIDVNKAVSCG